MKANLLRPLLYFVSILLALGFAARTRAQVNPTGTPKSANSSENFNIAVESWAKPASGWLYVLDPQPNAGEPSGRVWLVDPETAKVLGSIRTGAGADFALSPDGSRLYVASVMDGASSELAVIDPSVGVVLQRSVIADRAVFNSIPPFSMMAVSGDGSALRILIERPTLSDKEDFLLTALDTQTGSFLPGSVHVGNCGPGRFIAYPTATQFDILCPRTNRVRMITVDPDSRELQNTGVVLPWERRIGTAEAIEPSGSQGIAIVRGDGAVVTMNVATQQFSDTSAHPDLPNRVLPAAWPASPDGSKVYLGYNRDYSRFFDNRFYLEYGRPPNVRPDTALAGEFRVLDTLSWRKIGTIKTSMPFWSAVGASDGKTLYALAPQKQSILVIDTEKMRQVGSFKVGGTPALALVAP